MASNLLAMASNLLAMASNLLGMASNLLAMAFLDERGPPSSGGREGAACQTGNKREGKSVQIIQNTISRMK